MKSVQIKGAKEIIRKLDRLERAVRNKIVRQGLRIAAKIIQTDIKSRVPVLTGAYRSAIKVRAAKKSRTRIGLLVTTGADDFDNFYPKFLEWGTHNPDGTWKQEPLAPQRTAFEVKGATARDAALRFYRDEIQRHAA